MRITISMLLLACLSGIQSLYAQSCGCDKTITASSSYLVDGITMNIKPGDTICIMAGTRTNLTFRNLAGEAGNPIVIINCGGKAVINSPTSYGMKFERSNHFKITGTGSADSLGLEVKNSYHGIYLGDFTNNFEIDHIDIHDIPFAGIMAKTDPVCSDTNTWRQNFTMTNIFIHHNYIHNTVNGEGLYIGYSFYANGITCGTQTAFPHAIENIKVHHNITHNTGCEGIQVGCATKDCEIFNNKVTAFGQRPFSGSNSQQNGIQIGEGTGGKCYNNFIVADPINRGANGIIVLGIGDNLLYNNVIVNPGLSGFFIDERPPALISDTVSGYWIINNTIINPATDGIKTYAELVNKNEIKNNIIIKPGSNKYINTLGGPGIPTVVQGNNYFSTSINAPQFVYPDTNNFHLKITSPCIDAAENAAHWNIFEDFFSTARPKGIAFEIGALEFDTSLVNTPPYVYAGNDTIILYPVDSVNLNGMVSDPDGLIDTYFWKAVEPDTILLLSPGTLSTRAKNLRPGINIFSLTAVDNGNKHTTDSIVVHVILDNNIPIVVAGNDTSLFLPENQLVLKGKIIDSSEKVILHYWKQIQGPSLAVIEDSLSLSTTVASLVAGTYVFRLVVRDSLGQEYFDDITLWVKQNMLPQVNAGTDQRYSNRLTSIPLNGTAVDSDGTIASVVWTQTSGSPVILVNKESLNAGFQNFVPGEYRFHLSATDNKGAQSGDEVIVKVNQNPVVNAGADLVVSTLSGIAITGTGTDPEGDPITFTWTKVAGPSITMSGTSTNRLSLSNLGYGTYTFRLTVKDSYGDFTSDDVVLQVNRPPVANAGSNRTIRLSQNPYVLIGSGTDQDGTIVSYQWTKDSGTTVTLSNQNTPSLTISNFVVGTYTFRLTVRDNYGAESSDTVTIKVRR